MLGGAAPREPRATPSGLPVPRWVTLKHAASNARNGPGPEHRLLWTYRSRGLPVQVVAETREWRRICDSEGRMSWVHKRLTGGERGAVNLGPAPLAVHARGGRGSPVRAYLAPGGRATLDRCREGWCRVSAGGVRGFVPQAGVWGAAETVQCDAPPRD